MNISLTRAQVDWVVGESIRWVQDERRRYLTASVALEPRIQSGFSRYFSADLLGQVRVCRVGAIPSPPFFPELQRIIPVPLPDFTLEMNGMTFVETVCLRGDAQEPLTRANVALLFHELVHVCQFTLLGVEAFMEHYVNGWVNNGFQYKLIPLEMQAYCLQERFESSRDAFQVEQLICQSPFLRA